MHTHAHILTLAKKPCDMLNLQASNNNLRCEDINCKFCKIITIALQTTAG